MMSLITGKRLALDVGGVRTGMALSDSLGITIAPLSVVETSQAIDHICALCEVESITAIYIGLPLQLSGIEGSSSQMARQFASKLAGSISLPIRLIDERLTTSSAYSNSSKRSADLKKEIDALAAVEILKFALSIEAAQGDLAGEAI
jgi:putative Holliday junction resolvase